MIIVINIIAIIITIIIIVIIIITQRDNTEKIWVHRFFVRQKTNISKMCKFNLAVWMNGNDCGNDHKMS